MEIIDYDIFKSEGALLIVIPSIGGFPENWRVVDGKLMLEERFIVAKEELLSILDTCPDIYVSLVIGDTVSDMRKICPR